MSRRRSRARGRPVALSPAGRRRHRWLARAVVAAADAPAAYREAILDACRALNAGTPPGPAADALADTLAGLILDALEYAPPPAPATPPGKAGNKTANLDATTLT